MPTSDLILRNNRAKARNKSSKFMLTPLPPASSLSPPLPFSLTFSVPSSLETLTPPPHRITTSPRYSVPSQILQLLTSITSSKRTPFSTPPHSALILFLEMRRRPIAPDSYTFNFVLGACGLLQNSHSLAKALHAQLTKFGILEVVHVHSTLCCTYGRSGDVDSAEGVFEGSSFRDVVSYSVMIDAFFKAGEFDRARKLFDEMPHSFKDVVSYNAMIDGLFKAGDIHRARELFEEMPISFRNAVSYTAMIDGLFKAGEFDGARDLFYEMPHSLRNVVSYNAMIDGLSKAGDIHRAKELFDEMSISFRDVVSYNAMIVGLFKAGEFDRTRDLFDEMPVSLRNVVSYSVMLMGLAKHGHGGSVLEHYLSRMVEDGVKPDGGTILAVLVGCSHSGLVNEAKRIFMEMENVYGVPREIQHYVCMVDVLARAGLIKEARELIEGMPMGGKTYAWGALLGGCKIHRDVEVAEEAAKHLLQAKPNYGGVYSTLAHIYSILGQWNDVVKMRRLRHRQEIDGFVSQSSIIK